MSNFRKRIDPTLRDIRPIRPQRAEQSSLRDDEVGDRPQRKIRFPKKLVKPLFILGLAALILTVSLFSIQSLFKDEAGQGALGHLKDLLGTLAAVSSDVNKLKDNGFDFAFHGRGEELIALLKNLQTNVAKLQALEVGFIDKTTLETAKGGLDALITFLDKPGEERLLVLFLNPSEMRPIGGFSGSYAEIVLERGNIKKIDVNDIYYPDRFLERKIVPPRQLQTVTVDWGARDAAWFFDFPTSAQKTMELIEASDVYAKDNIHFDGVISLNVRVIEDILTLTGPIEVPEYNLTLDKDNFLEEIQQEVEEGRDKKPGENPKQVLSALTPILIEKMSKLDSSDKNTLALALLTGATNKDIQFYFEDAEIEKFVKKIGWAGEVASLPDDRRGDYLAVVNTNVAGGKTDARIEQKIKLKSEINASGQVNNHLTITRRHFGRADDAPWYQTKNQNFIKIFTVPEAELVSLTGATPKNISPQIDYSVSGYSTDSILSALERTRKITKYSTEEYIESGKKVFATWFSVVAGESKALEVNYKSSQFSLGDGVKYKFIFDKQSGVESNFEYEVVAPPGYKWQETNGATFAYKSDTVPARLVFEFTLVRNF